MNIFLFLFILIILSSQTYLCYLIFLLCMIHLVFIILLLGHFYLSLIYLLIYIGSIAILFIYILMVLSIISSYRSGYLLFLLPIFISFSLCGFIISFYGNFYTLLNYSYSFYTSLLIPIGLILLISMIFAIRSI